MRKFLLASHGTLSLGMKNSIELIMGDQSILAILAAYTSKDYDLKEEVDKILCSLDEKDELIVVTDIFGGSVNNEFLQRLDEHKNLFLIAGMSLPLLIELLAANEKEKDTRIMIRQTLDTAKNSVQFCNDVLTETRMEPGKEEEF